MWSPPLLLNLGCLCLGWRIARLWLRRGQVPERLLLGVVLTWLTWRDALDTLLLRPPRAAAEGDWVPTALQLTFHAAALPDAPLGSIGYVGLGLAHLLLGRCPGPRLANYGLFFALGLSECLLGTARLLHACGVLTRAEAQLVALRSEGWLRMPGLLLGLCVWHQQGPESSDDVARWVRALHNVMVGGHAIFRYGRAIVRQSRAPLGLIRRGAVALAAVPMALTAMAAVLAPFGATLSGGCDAVNVP